MDDPKKQLVEKLKTANNVLVTVSRNPSVDQLASCIGLTLLLNKQGKHAAAVFSGEVPSTLEFLQPETTLEKNTDSLRDFIIALDKSKADKLRYKVEDNVVRIFITPYKTSISQADLEFSEGDFNVDVVVALGVKQQEDLDEAITAHGRILHDATVTSINITSDGALGSVNWYDPAASSLSELVTELAETIGDNLLDEQIATALLTGIVSETDRFSNNKTSSQTMSSSARLMAAGANQQLVASKLQGGVDVPIAAPPQGTGGPTDAGTLRINHPDDQAVDPAQNNPSIQIDSNIKPPVGLDNNFLPGSDNSGLAKPAEPDFNKAPASGMSSGSKLMTEPPAMSGMLTANSATEGLDPSSDPLSLPSDEAPKMLNHKPEVSIDPAGTPLSQPAPGPSGPPPLADSKPEPVLDQNQDRTLSDLEKAVGHSSSPPPDNVSTARNEVDQAISADGAAPDSDNDKPLQALSAQPLGEVLHNDKPTDPGPLASPMTGPGSPPPVPPPIPFQFGEPPPEE